MGIGQVIQGRRRGSRLTVDEASRKAGVSRSYWEKLEAGQMSNPSVRVLGKIAFALDCSVPDLLKDAQVVAAA